MRIHLDQIKENGLSLSYSEPAEAFPVLTELIQNDEIDFLKPVDTQLQVVRISDMIKVDGTFTTTLRINCDRCLKAYEIDLENDFMLTYTNAYSDGPESEDEEQELSSEEMGLIHFRGEEIDLRQGIQEQVVLALPFRNICSEDCKGLCPQCGVDLNLSSCTCAKVVSAGKFAALRELKLKDQ